MRSATYSQMTGPRGYRTVAIGKGGNVKKGETVEGERGGVEGWGELGVTLSRFNATDCVRSTKLREFIHSKHVR